MDSKHEERILSGALASVDDLPEDQSHQVKVFLTCTSTDFCVERDAIISRIVPKIREQAKEKYGFEFHYMDLQWEAPEQCPEDFKHREFMLKELLRAQNLSAGPHYVVFLGQRYGSRPLPHLILSSVYELIQKALYDNRGRKSRGVNLMDKWYNKDENSIPAVHVLNNALLENVCHYNCLCNHKEELSAQWAVEKEQLRQVLQFGVELSCKQGNLPPEAIRNYFVSELENEVKHGLLNEANEKSIMFERTITDLSNYVTEERAHAFTEIIWNEIDEKWEQNRETIYLLEGLKKQTVYTKVSNENTSQYSLLWRFDSGVHPELHKEYVDEFCQQFHDSMMKLIAEAAAVSQARRKQHSALYNEVSVHLRKALSRSQNCHGQEEILRTVTHYLQDQSNSEPFTLYGESGSGKTTILAKLQTEVIHSTLPSDTVIVSRYCGLTHSSSDLRELLYSICHQVKVVLNEPLDIPTDFKTLQKYFIDLLYKFPVKRHLVVLIDSLQCLKPDHNAHMLLWLPNSLPAHVRMIITCLPKAYGMLTRLKTELFVNQENFREAVPLGVDNAMQLLLYWLQSEGMSITNTQAELVMAKLASCSYPLYIKLIFQEMKQWRSFDEINPYTLGTDCASYINSMLDQLEEKHGDSIVRQAVSYLTASQTGLSDMEMEDLLSIDEKVMSVAFSDKTPCVRRCPPYIWAHLRNDLDPFLQLKVSDDVDVYFWFHRMFVHVIESRYMSDPNVKKAIHEAIADYYLGKWHGKPMMYTDAYGRASLSDRFVQSQPLTYINSLGQTIYNKRKYDQVPRHLYLSGRLEELNSRVLFNYDWLYNKIKVLSLQHILADLSLNPSTEAVLLEGALRAAQSIIAEDMNNLPIELSGRLLPYYRSHPNLRSLIQQCDTLALKHCALVPAFNYHQVPGSPLQYTLKSADPIEQIHLIKDGRFLLSKSNESQYVRKYDLTTGEVKSDILASYGKMHITPDEKHMIIVDNEIEKAIKVHDTETGQFKGQFIPLNFIAVKDRSKYNLGALSITNQYVALIITAGSNYLCVASLQDFSQVRVLKLECKSNVVKISPNNNFVLCSMGCNIHAYDILSLQQICLTQLDHAPASLIFTQQGTRTFVTNQVEKLITVVHLSSDGYTQMISKISLNHYMGFDKIQSINLSHSQRYLLVRGLHNVIVYDMSVDDIVMHRKRPSNVMAEFRLPKHIESTPIVFTEAMFSFDDNVLITSIFRNVQFWNIKSGNMIGTTIQAPVGIIAHMQLSAMKGQVITHLQESDLICVWNMQEYVTDISSMDRLTSPIQTLQLTKNNTHCFITGADSDEVGVIDMETGQLSDLFTHGTIVKSLTATADGQFAFVSLDPSTTEQCNKIWSVPERRIIHEFGKVLGSAVSLNHTSTIIYLAQQSTAFKAPFCANFFHFKDDSFEEWTYDFLINHIISKPFITANDTYMVMLTADEYLEKKAIYANPAICAFYLKSKISHAIYSKNEFGKFLDNRYIVALVSVKNHSTEVIALYKSRESVMANGKTTPYGFMCIDLASGNILRYSDNFMPGSTALHSLCLSNDGSFCVNSDLGMLFDMKTGGLLSKIGNQKNPIVLMNEGKVAAYYRGAYLIAERIWDNKIIAKCDVHVDICNMCLSKDDITLVIGCVDGTVLSYVLVDEDTMDVESVVATIPSRIKQSIDDQMTPTTDGRTSRCWDQTEVELSRAYSRPPSVLSLGPSDQEVLRKIRPVQRAYSHTRSLNNSYSSYRQSVSAVDRSKTCAIM